MTDDELRDVSIETGHKHHEAYATSDGVDPEWALWYAGHLQTKLWDGLGKLLPRSEIVYGLIRGELEARTSDDPSQWPSIYARVLRELAAE